jgi:hypothetical protein
MSSCELLWDVGEGVEEEGNGNENGVVKMHLT